MLKVIIPKGKCARTSHESSEYFTFNNKYKWKYGLIVQPELEDACVGDIRLPSELLFEGDPSYNIGNSQNSCTNFQAKGTLYVRPSWDLGTELGLVPCVLGGDGTEIFFYENTMYDKDIRLSPTSYIRIVKSSYAQPSFLVYYVKLNSAKTKVISINVDLIMIAVNKRGKLRTCKVWTVSKRANDLSKDRLLEFPPELPGYQLSFINKQFNDEISSHGYPTPLPSWYDWPYDQSLPLDPAAQRCLITHDFAPLGVFYEKQLQFAIRTLPYQQLVEQWGHLALTASKSYHTEGNMLEFWKDILKFGNERKLWSDVVDNPSVDTVADAYLGTQYGSRLTVADADAWADLIKKHFWRNREQHLAAAKARSEFDPGPLNGMCVQQNAYVTYALHYDPRQNSGDYTLSRILDELGLKPDTKRIWELLPFSFVVDWIFNVSDAANAWEANQRLMRLRIYGETKTYKIVYTILGPYGPIDLILYDRCCSPRASIQSCTDLSFRPSGLSDHSIEATALTYKQVKKLRRN